LTIDPKSAPPLAIYKLMIGSIVPRPIAFVSTLSVSGVRNLAPFSFFNGVSGDPPVICFSVTGRTPHKDTLANIQETGEFVVNIVSEEIAEQLNLCAGEYPPEVDEFELSGLTAAPSALIRPPRVLESRVSMECTLHQIVEVGTLPRGASLVLGEVLRFHVEDAIVDNFRIDPEGLRAIGRMGGNTYARTRERFDMIRPQA
jgi:flavin reductase (DIM6/NTAB) family NADH-FMN oxidoreductase RutF